METFDRTILEEKKAKAAELFTKIQGEIKEIEFQEAIFKQKKNELNVELFRLQGENRLIDDLLAPPEAAKPDGE